MLVVASVEGATPVAGVRGHTAAATTASTAAANPLDPLTAEEIQRTSPAENVNGNDVVVWYTPAFTHVPHVEDYPVMTTESAHFHIEPDGFFDSNPALDAPSQ